MMIKEITLSRGRKYSDNYQTTDYNVAITFEVNEYENAKEEMYQIMSELESHEIEHCRDVLLVMNHIEGTGEKSVPVRIEGESRTAHPPNNLEGVATTDSTPLPELKTVQTTKTGKYTWYALKDGGKVRKCNNEGCDFYLKWNDEKKTYEHGKYDADKMVWYYSHDRCDYYLGGGS